MHAPDSVGLAGKALEGLSLSPTSSAKEKNKVMPTVEKVKSVCAFCQQEAVEPIRCDRCKSLQYCSKSHKQAHWQAHKPGCKEVFLIKNNLDLIPRVESCLRNFQFTNTEIRFRYETDEITKPAYKFRIIFNPQGWQLSLGKFVLKANSVMAYDGKYFPVGVAELINSTFKIENTLTGQFKGQNYFDLGANVQVLH